MAKLECLALGLCDPKALAPTQVSTANAKDQMIASIQNSVKTREDGNYLALTVKTPHAEKFCADLANRKSYEIRKGKLTFLKEGERACLLKVDSRCRDSSGSAVWQVLAILEFRGCIKILNSEVDSYFEFHQVEPNEFAQLQAGWSGSNDFCFAWKFETVEVFQQPLQVPSKPGARGWVWISLDELHDFSSHSSQAAGFYQTNKRLASSSSTILPFETPPAKRSKSEETVQDCSVVGTETPGTHETVSTDPGREIECLKDLPHDSQVVAVILQPYEWKALLRGEPCIVRSFACRHSRLFIVVRDQEAFYWVGVASSITFEETTWKAVSQSESCKAVYDKMQLEHMKDKKKLCIWTMLEIDVVSEPSRTAWLDGSAYRNRTFKVRFSHLNSPRVSPPKSLDLRETCRYFVDYMPEMYRNSLLGQISKLSGKTLRVGAACSGSDICINVLKQTLEHLNAIQDAGCFCWVLPVAKTTF